MGNLAGDAKEARPEPGAARQTGDPGQGLGIRKEGSAGGVFREGSLLTRKRFEGSEIKVFGASARKKGS